METVTVVPPIVKTMAYNNDQLHTPQTPQTPRRDLAAYTRAQHDHYHSVDQGPGPTTFELTPPRTGLKLKSKNVSHAPTKMLNDQEGHISAEQTIALFKEKIEAARAEAQKMVTNEGGQDAALKPTLTINLGNARINRLPDSVIALIMADVERISLSHNYLRYLPTRLKDCSQLRYLNLRNNELGDFPPAVYAMQFLEILDLSKNQILTISPEIRNMHSLRVFSITNNRLLDLPVEFADLQRLKVMKIADNPLKRQLREVIKTKQTEVEFMELSDNDKDTALTAEILKYLRRIDPTTTNTPTLENIELNEPQIDLSRPARRISSGRFPVVPAMINAVATPTGNSPEQVQIQKPTIPLRSHLRGVSSQNGNPKRPGVTPVITDNTERNRSHSESVVQNSQVAIRAKRAITLSKRPRGYAEGPDEQLTAKSSHLRGHSSASTFKRPDSISLLTNSSFSPDSPRDTRRGQFIRRLSALPEHRERSMSSRPLIEGARGILYALFQANNQISNVLQAIRRSTSTMSQVDMVFHAAHKHLDTLNKSLEGADRVNHEDEDRWNQAEDTVSRDCAACVSAYMHVAQCMQTEVRKIIAEADPRYVRTLMLLLYGSIIEVRNAIKHFGVEIKTHRRQMSSGHTHPIQTIPEEPSPSEEGMQPIDTDMNGMTVKQVSRMRTSTILQQPSHADPTLQPVKLTALQIPQNIVLTGTALDSSSSRASSASGSASGRRFGLRSRSNSRNINHIVSNDANSATSTILRSVEGGRQSYMSTYASNMNGSLNDSEGDVRFAEIFMALTKSYEAALQAIPLTSKQFQRCLDTAKNTQQPNDVVALWTALVEKCRTCLDLTQALQVRLSSMRIGDSAVGLNALDSRHDPQFWLLCRSFLQSFVGLVTEMRQVKNRGLLSPEIVAVLRPVQKACRDAGHCIDTSPWSSSTSGMGIMPAPTPMVGRGELNHSNSSAMNKSANNSNNNLQAFSAGIARTQSNLPPLRPALVQATPSSSALPTPMTATFMHGPSTLPSQLPATPLSAALGPAVQATVPAMTTMSTASEAFFRGDVFQRADHLMSQPKAVGNVNFLGKRI